MDLYSLIQQMIADGTFGKIAANVQAQFGTPQRRYLGASILPERNVADNAYREDAIRYRTVIANSGSRYSPAQKKAGGALLGSFLVELGNQDIAVEFTARDYDGLLRLLNNNAAMQAELAIINWVDIAVNRALIEETERQRWEVLVSAQTVLKGDNGYEETVQYPDPAGHRVAAGGVWSNDAYDPYDDIIAQTNLLTDKGYAVSRIVTSNKVMNILARNAKIAQRANPRFTISAGGQVGTVTSRVQVNDLNSVLAADGLPPIERYELRYRTQTESIRFMPDTVMMFFAEGGQDPNVDLGDNQPLVTAPLGYTAIGRGVGRSAPGRFIRVEAKNDKPPRIEAEGWQTSLPVVTEPEAIAVINTIS